MMYHKEKHKNQKLRFKPSRVALVVGSILLSTATIEQTAFAQDVSNVAKGNVTQDDVEVIEITGIKSSIEGALLEKRASDIITDGISADDLGNFPDLNLGEALQRIPGVQIDRENSRRSATISVRGLPGAFALTTVQGQGIASAGTAGRSANPFGMFDSSIFNGAYVTKSFRSDILSGGLSANVDLRINSALDRKDGQVVVKASAGYEELTQDIVPEFFMTGSKHFNDGKLGVYATASWQDMSFRRDVANINGYNVIGANASRGFGQYANVDRSGLEDNAVLITPREYRQESQISEGNRISFATGFEYVINDEMNFRLDGIYAKRDLSAARTNFLIVDLKRSPNQITQVGDITPIGLTNYLDPSNPDAPLLPTHVLSNFEFDDPSVNIEDRNFPTSEEVYAIYPQFNYEGENLKGRVIATLSEANNLRAQEQYRVSVNQVGNNADIDDSNGITGSINTGLGNWDNFAFNYNLPDGALALQGEGVLSGNDISINRLTGLTPRLRCAEVIDNACTRDAQGNIIYNELDSRVNNGVVVTGGNTAARRTYQSLGTDWEYSLYDVGPITGVKVGAMYTKEEGEAARADNSAIGLNTSNFPEQIFGTLIDQSDSITKGNGYFGGKLPGAEIDDYLSIQIPALVDVLLPVNPEENTTNEPLITDIPLFSDLTPYYQRGPNAVQRRRTSNFTSERESLEAFVMVNFSGDDYDIPVRGNLGLRYVTADMSGRLLNPAVVGTADVENSYTDILPSVNIIYDLTDDVVLRGAYYETFETPELTEFSPAPTTIEISLPNDDPDSDNFGLTSVTANITSVDVEPRTSKAYDLGFAWYNRKGSLVGLNYFNKEVIGDIDKQVICPSEGITLTGELTILPNAATADSFETGALLLDGTTCRIDDGFTGEDLTRNRRIRIEQNVNLDAVTTVEGIEFQIIQNLDFLDNFFKDFGFQFNYTKISNRNSEDRPLDRVSPETYNLIGYYERDNYGIRLAYNFRDEYGVQGASTAVVGERIVGARGQLDLQANYKFDNNIDVRLQMFNLTDEDPFEYQDTELLPRRLQYDGRTVKLSVQKRF
ncbi:TonB-dependent receptor [Paraglaciecola aquimarina]|uniref:TonB-dependent receptor n=1 Tax=Paraglaciecola algarum TaxID=3050085 RepID=A0ABS9D7F0_9ALTE|nr:TonB-dependent receptor [Paraglaciecola sp. G1-23]MCF2948883.1 TonB-dependent receptor [Paraglaciecola sp. G1-23]